MQYIIKVQNEPRNQKNEKGRKMMTQITVNENAKVFKFENQYEVMILTKQDVDFDFKGDYLIRAKDGANALEYNQTKAFVNLINPKYVYTVRNSDFPKWENRISLNNAGETFISSFGLYQGLANSTMPKAEPFQDWLYEEMLPAVQTHGMYATPAVVDQILGNPEFGIQLLTTIKEEREARKTAEATLEEQKPLVGFANICLKSEDCVKVREYAHSLSSHGIRIGEKKLYKKFREWGFVCKKSTEPTQRAINQGLFNVVQGEKEMLDGKVFLWRTPYVTVKGQVYFTERLRQEELIDYPKTAAQ